MFSTCLHYLPLKLNDGNGIKKRKMLYDIPRNINMKKEKMVKPVQDYARCFRVKIGRRRSRGAARSVSSASIPVELIPIIRKRITYSLHAPSTTSVSLHSPHSLNLRYPLTGVAYLTLLPKSSSLSFSPLLCSTLSFPPSSPLLLYATSHSLYVAPALHRAPIQPA